MRSLACWAAETFMGDKIFANLLSHSRTKSVQELQKCIAQRDEYRDFWMREARICIPLAWRHFTYFILPGMGTERVRCNYLPCTGCSRCCPRVCSYFAYISRVVLTVFLCQRYFWIVSPGQRYNTLQSH